MSEQPVLFALDSIGATPIPTDLSAETLADIPRAVLLASQRLYDLQGALRTSSVRFDWHGKPISGVKAASSAAAAEPRNLLDIPPFVRAPSPAQRYWMRNTVNAGAALWVARFLLVNSPLCGSANLQTWIYRGYMTTICGFRCARPPRRVLSNCAALRCTGDGMRRQSRMRSESLRDAPRALAVVPARAGTVPVTAPAIARACYSGACGCSAGTVVQGQRRAAAVERAQRVLRNLLLARLVRHVQQGRLRGEQEEPAAHAGLVRARRRPQGPVRAAVHSCIHSARWCVAHAGLV